MTALALMALVGLALSLLPWKPVAVAVGVGAVIWIGYMIMGTGGSPVPLMGPALLLGWACGLLIRRTIAERKAP